MAGDLKQRLRFGPDFDTNATIPMVIGWYAEITDEAADRIELLEAELDELRLQKEGE